MKTRNGFVSNSSSSSFVVAHKRLESDSVNKKYKSIKLLTNNQVKLLKKIGFKYSMCNNPYFVDAAHNITSLDEKAFNKFCNIYLTYSVICNQDDVIYALLKNKIPFVALCHYDEEFLVWDGKTDCFYQTNNIIEDICDKNGNLKFDVGENNQYIPAELTPKIDKINIKEWLTKEEKHIESLV